MAEPETVGLCLVDQRRKTRRALSRLLPRARRLRKTLGALMSMRDSANTDIAPLVFARLRSEP